MQEPLRLADLQNWSAAAGDDAAVRLALFGHPAAHSLSPRMQNAALEHCGLKMRYAAYDIAPDELADALRLLVEHQFVGANLTIPHKIRAVADADELDEFARRVGAINAVRVEGDKLVGFNTDGPGFAHAIRSEFSVDLSDLRVLVLGAGGGAGRSIAVQCAVERCERLVLANRTREKAEQLANELKPAFADTRVSGPVARLQVVPWDEEAIREQIANIDLVVNATSLGMKHSDPPVIPTSAIEPHLMIYDTVYTTRRTPLLAAAAEAGARGANGLPMLLHQGAFAFERWFERDAPIDVMRAALL